MSSFNGRIRLLQCRKPCRERSFHSRCASTDPRLKKHPHFRHIRMRLAQILKLTSVYQPTPFNPELDHLIDVHFVGFQSGRSSLTSESAFQSARSLNCHLRFVTLKRSRTYSFSQMCIHESQSEEAPSPSGYIFRFVNWHLCISVLCRSDPLYIG